MFRGLHQLVDGHSQLRRDNGDAGRLLGVHLTRIKQQSGKVGCEVILENFGEGSDGNKAVIELVQLHQVPNELHRLGGGDFRQV